MPAGFEYIRQLDALSEEDAPLVGVNGLNLGKLRRKGLPVSDGFVITTRAFDLFARISGLEKSVAWFAERASVDDALERDRYARMVETIMRASRIPDGVKEAILVQYWELCKRSGAAAVLARCSFPAEVSAEPSFMGQRCAFFDLMSEEELLAAVKRCWASVYHPLAVRLWSQRFAGRSLIPCAVVVQEQGSAGVDWMARAGTWGGRRETSGDALASLRTLIGDPLPALDNNQHRPSYHETQD